MFLCVSVYNRLVGTSPDLILPAPGPATPRWGGWCPGWWLGEDYGLRRVRGVTWQLKGGGARLKFSAEILGSFFLFGLWEGGVCFIDSLGLPYILF